MNIAVMTVSDTRTLEDDKSGDTLVDRLVGTGHKLVGRKSSGRTEQNYLASRLGLMMRMLMLFWRRVAGTGRDVTPEAFSEVCEKDIPGFGELSAC